MTTELSRDILIKPFHAIIAIVDKFRSWLGKEVVYFSKDFHHSAEKIGSTAEKTTSTFLETIKSPSFQGPALIALGVGLTAFSTFKFSEINYQLFAWKREYVLPVAGIITGIALIALGFALTTGRL